MPGFHSNLFDIDMNTDAWNCRWLWFSLVLAWGAPFGVLAADSCQVDGCAEEADTEFLHVRTTAYWHGESDHVRYGRKNAVGDRLKFGSIRSAAADWSKFPLGTVFRVEGVEALYVVDDYGSALVGKNTLDLYKPSSRRMRQWGVRMVDIEVIKWGSLERSLAVLRPRARVASHVRKMVRAIEARIEESVSS